MSKVVVIIVGFRCGEAIAECLTALGASDFRDFEVQIVENGGSASFGDLVQRVGALSTDPSAPVALADPGCPLVDREGQVVLQHGGQPVRLLRGTGNLGYACAINVVLARLRPRTDWDAVWVLNPDTEPAPGALGALHARLSLGYGVVGSRLVLERAGTIQMYGGRWRWHLGRGFNIGMGAPADATPDIAAIERDMDYVSGASMLVSRAYVETIGPMSEEYFLYAEEVDWCMRRGSFRLGYAHDSIVLHAHGETIGSSLSRKLRSGFSVYLDERSKMLFSRKFDRRRFPLTALIALVLTAQYLKAGAWRNFGQALAGWFAGLRGETHFPARFMPRR